MLTAVLFVLKTGIGWKDLPTEAFDCRTRPARDESTSGPPRHLATDPRVVPGRSAGLVAGAGRLQFGESPAGRTKTGPNPTDRGRSGSKHCVLTDADGVPLVVQTVPANQHDVTTLLPLVVDMPAVAGKPGRPKRKPDHARRRQSVRLPIAAQPPALARHRTAAAQTRRR